MIPHSLLKKWIRGADEAVVCMRKEASHKCYTRACFLTPHVRSKVAKQNTCPEKRATDRPGRKDGSTYIVATTHAYRRKVGQRRQETKAHRKYPIAFQALKCFQRLF